MFSMAKWEVVVLIALIVLAMGGGVVLWEKNKVRPTLEITLPIESAAAEMTDSPLVDGTPPEAQEALSNPVELIWVDVTGAVLDPGVYQLPLGARVAEAIAQAGGMTEEADPDGLSVSRASRLVDEQRIHIPRQGESVLPIVGGEKAAAVQNTGSGCININSAANTELETLPGIGKVRAQNTVSNRPFSRLEELLEQKIVPPNVYYQILDQICL